MVAVSVRGNDLRRMGLQAETRQQDKLTENGTCNGNRVYVGVIRIIEFPRVWNKGLAVYDTIVVYVRGPKGSESSNHTHIGP